MHGGLPGLRGARLHLVLPAVATRRMSCRPRELPSELVGRLAGRAGTYRYALKSCSMAVRSIAIVVAVPS
jgi:hypothetical protein